MIKRPVSAPVSVPRINRGSNQARGLLLWTPFFQNAHTTVEPVIGRVGVFSTSGGTENTRGVTGRFGPRIRSAQYSHWVPFDAMPASNAPWSIMGWALGEGDFDYITSFGPSVGDSNTVGIYLYNAGTTLRVQMNSTAVIDTVISSVLKSAGRANAWHYAATFDGSNVRAYFNGVLVATATSVTYTKTGSTPYAFFCGYESAYNGGYHPTSWDNRIYGRALSPSEIFEAFSAPSKLWTGNSPGIMRVGSIASASIDAPEGWLSKRLTPEGWFGRTQQDLGWFSERLMEVAPSAGSAYTLNGLAGSYTLTGQSATLAVGRALSGLSGSYTMTGRSATLSVGRSLAGNSGTYSLTGQAATLSVGRALNGSAGSYSVTGQSATLTYTPVGAYELVALAGSYTLTGQDATMTYTPADASVRGGFGPSDERRPVPLDVGDFLPAELPSVTAESVSPGAVPVEAESNEYTETRALDALSRLDVRLPVPVDDALPSEFPIDDFLDAFAEQQRIADEEAALMLLLTIH